MSRHTGVSCDACKKLDFPGRRYKCLVCYDYDLCAACQESGACTVEHSPLHPVQCFLPHADFELYYGGEAGGSVAARGSGMFAPQTFSCPYCGLLGFTPASLSEHADTKHRDAHEEVICPLCVPEGKANYVTNSFATHLHHYHGRNPPHPSANMEEDELLEAAMHAGGGRLPPSLLRGMARSRLSGADVFGAFPPPQQRQSGATALASLTAAVRSGGADFGSDPFSDLLSQMTRHRSAEIMRVTDQLHEIEAQLLSTRRQLEGRQAALERSLAGGSSTTPQAFTDRYGGGPPPTDSPRPLASSGRGLTRQDAIRRPAGAAVVGEGASAEARGVAGGAAAAGGTGRQVKKTEGGATRYLLSRLGAPGSSGGGADINEAAQIVRGRFVQDLLLSSISVTPHDPGVTPAPCVSPLHATPLPAPSPTASLNDTDSLPSTATNSPIAVETVIENGIAIGDGLGDDVVNGNGSDLKVVKGKLSGAGGGLLLGEGGASGGACDPTGEVREGMNGSREGSERAMGARCGVKKQRYKQ